MTCLITGCEGFLGSHLAEFLIGRGIRVIGMAYRTTEALAHLVGALEVAPCDIRDRARVADLVHRIRPAMVFHLAAQSYVTVSWERPDDTLHTNVIGTFNLLESLRDVETDPLVVVVGSSSVYGDTAADEIPISEDRAFRPTNAYAVSKIAEEMLGHFFWRAYGMRVVRVRPFNLTGPRKISDACSDFTRGIVEVERGQRTVLEVGNLSAVRDIMDGRDGARALALLAERGRVGEVYNLCSGQGRRIGDVLALCMQVAGRQPSVRSVPSKLRILDDPIYVGDNSKLRELGWTPEIPLEVTIRDLLQYWRATLACGRHAQASSRTV